MILKTKYLDLKYCRSQLLSSIASLEEQVEQLEAKYGNILIDEHHYLLFYRFPGVQFHYQTPREGFDRTRVNGVVAKLIDMKDPKYATALEITAGGKVSCESKYVYAQWSD